MGGGIGRVAKHPDYYLNDGSVSFLTGKTLFKVHRSFFERESEVFRELFASAAEDDPLSGTDARPFTLDVQPEEFEQLLWVWYDREYSYRKQSKDRWVTILRLSTRWEFSKIRELAIRELEALELPPAERISIYNEHGIEGEQFLSSCIEICKSPTVPTEADGRLIPMDVLINILQAREDAQRKAGELGHESPTSASLEDDALKEIISKLFNKGLNLRPHGTSTGSGDQASDGERARTTIASSSTITLAEPQVPDRTAQSASRQPQSHPHDSLQTGSEGKGSREKEQGKGKEVERKNAREKAKEEASNEGKALKASQDKEREEKEKQEKARQAKEKEEKERMEKAKKDKEKEAREKAEKAEKAEQKSSQNSRGNFWSILD